MPKLKEYLLKIQKFYWLHPEHKLLTFLLVIFVVLSSTVVGLTAHLNSQLHSESPLSQNVEGSPNTNNSGAVAQNIDNSTPSSSGTGQSSTARRTSTNTNSNSPTSNSGTPQSSNEANGGSAGNGTGSDSDEDESQPPESPSATVAFYGDNQSDSDTEDFYHQRVVNYLLSITANPIFHAGDLMEDGTQNSLDRFNAVTSTLRSSRTFYGALGNNDRKIGDASTPSPLYLDNFTFPNNEQWYSVNVGNLHMVVLDSAFSSNSVSQLSWLEADLQSEASQSRLTGVMFHHPTFASAISTYLVNYGVDFVVSGHTHSYSHSTSNNIHYFVTSGQPSIGYLKVEIYQDKAMVSSYDHNNSLIESSQVNER